MVNVMKRFGFKTVAVAIQNGAFIRQDTMPFKTSFPDYAVMGYDDDCNEIVYGYVSYDTFYNLYSKGIIHKKHTAHSFNVYY